MKFLLGFISGVSVGTMLALVLAPQTGSDTRRFLTDQAKYRADQARHRAQLARDRLRNQGQEWLDEAGVMFHREA